MSASGGAGRAEPGSGTGSVTSSSATGLNWADSSSDPGETFHIDQALEGREREGGERREGREREEEGKENEREKAEEKGNACY